MSMQSIGRAHDEAQSLGIGEAFNAGAPSPGWVWLSPRSTTGKPGVVISINPTLIGEKARAQAADERHNEATR